MIFDHIALSSKNIDETINWYIENLNASVLYQDETWGLVSVGGIKIAFVIKSQHPSHVCFEVDDSYIDQYLSNKIFKEHRDESSSCYVKDIDGNHIEFLKWPKKNG